MSIYLGWIVKGRGGYVTDISQTLISIDNSIGEHTYSSTLISKAKTVVQSVNKVPVLSFEPACICLEYSWGATAAEIQIYEAFALVFQKVTTDLNLDLNSVLKKITWIASLHETMETTFFS